jgi:cob(I)alamin adenosyltransferase
MKRKAKNPITVIRTGTGDQGTTWFRGNPTHPKDSDEILYLSYLDLIQSKSYFLKTVQDLCFALGAHYNNPKAKQYEHTIEAMVEGYDKTLKDSVSRFLPLKGFVRSNGYNTRLMELRSVVRQTELIVCRINSKCDQKFDIDANMLHMKSLNVLSDYLFLLSWKETVEIGSLSTWNGIEIDESINKTKIYENIQEEFDSFL